MEHNFKFGNLTDVGLVRQANEDYYGCFDTGNGFVFVVCDGMGGHVGGAVASQTAVDAIRGFYDNVMHENVIVSMQNALSYANNAILNKIAESPDLEGMGTTAVLLIVKDDKVYYAHVGDSRIYYMHKKRLHRITRDHSLVQALVDAGHITEEEAEKHPKKNQITKALGIQSIVEATICNEPLLPVAGDCFLLCSDGLTGMVPDNIIGKIANSDKSNLQEKVAELIKLAKQNGGVDNITAQMIQFEKTSNSQSNFKIPAEIEKVNKTTSKVAGKPKLWLSVFGSVLILALLYCGYSYYFQTKTKVSTSHLINKDDSVNKNIVPDKRNASESNPQINDTDAEKEANKYDRQNESPVLDGNSEIQETNTDKNNGQIIDMYPYTILKGDNETVLAKKLKTSWSKLKADDKSYKDKVPLAGKVIKIRIRDKYVANDEKEMMGNITVAIKNNKLKDSSHLIFIRETYTILVKY